MKKITNILNYEVDKGQVFTQPSQTVPDQTMSLRTILDRYAKGLPIEGKTTEPVYDGEEYVPDPKTMDLAEREQFAEEAKAELEEFAKNQKEAQEAAKKAKAEAEAKKEEEYMTRLEQSLEARKRPKTGDE